MCGRLLFRMSLLIVLYYYLLIGILGCEAFEIVKFSPSSEIISDGDTLKLSCIVDAQYEWCRFSHGENTCKIQWINLPKGRWRKEIECSGFDERVKILALTFGMCSLKIDEITYEDSGEWKCVIKVPTKSHDGNLDHKISTVELNITTTTTTTTTTATTTTAANVTTNKKAQVATEETIPISTIKEIVKPRGARNEPSFSACPETHPYGSSDGQWCCRTLKSCVEEDQTPLTFNSSCCETNEFIECPGSKCSSFTGHDAIDTTSKIESVDGLTRINKTEEKISTEPSEKKIVYRRNNSLDNHEDVVELLSLGDNISNSKNETALMIHRDDDGLIDVNGWIILILIISMLIVVLCIIGLHFQDKLPKCFYIPCPGYRPYGDY